MVFCGLPVVLRSVLVMVRCLGVVLRSLLRHGENLR
jgi:hypothetical protein